MPVAPQRAHMPKAFLAAAVLALLSVTMPASACPSCAAGIEARTQVWRDDFAYFACAIALKFLIVLAVAWRVNAVGKPAAHADANTGAT
jgi:hypothetical protein